MDFYQFLLVWYSPSASFTQKNILNAPYTAANIYQYQNVSASIEASSNKFFFFCSESVVKNRLAIVVSATFFFYIRLSKHTGGQRSISCQQRYEKRLFLSFSPPPRPLCPLPTSCSPVKLTKFNARVGKNSII